MINKNPVPLATIPKGQEWKERKVFTPVEQVVFLKYIKDSYLYNFFALALMTGMRNGELRGLKWSDVDFVRLPCRWIYTAMYCRTRNKVRRRRFLVYLKICKVLN